MAYQAATPWPYTGTGSTPGQQAAFRDISDFVLGQLYGEDGQYPGGSCTRAGANIVSATADIRQLYATWT